MLTLLTIVFTVVCFLMIFMVIVTPGGEGGLASALGGGGGDSFFGAKAGRSVNRFTILLAVLFLVLAVVINRMGTGGSSATGKRFGGSGVEEKQPDGTPTPNNP